MVKKSAFSGWLWATFLAEILTDFRKDRAGVWIARVDCNEKNGDNPPTFLERSGLSGLLEPLSPRSSRSRGVPYLHRLSSLQYVCESSP